MDELVPVGLASRFAQRRNVMLTQAYAIETFQHVELTKPRGSMYAIYEHLGPQGRV